MQIRINGGQSRIELTKREHATLQHAKQLCEAIGRNRPESGGTQAAEQVAKVIEAVEGDGSLT